MSFMLTESGLWSIFVGLNAQISWKTHIFVHGDHWSMTLLIFGTLLYCLTWGNFTSHKSQVLKCEQWEIQKQLIWMEVKELPQQTKMDKYQLLFVGVFQLANLMGKPKKEQNHWIWQDAASVCIGSMMNAWNWRKKKMSFGTVHHVVWCQQIFQNCLMRSQQWGRT